MLPLSRFCLVGPPRLLLAGRVVTRFRTAQTASLLAYLALYPGVSHSREKLLALFWPDASAANARNSLSVALSSLRLLLETPETGGSILLTSRGSVMIAANALPTDVADWEAHLVRARHATTSQEAAYNLDAALAISAPTLLEGLYGNWILDEQARIAARREAARERRDTLPVSAPGGAETAPAAAAPSSTLPLPARRTRFFARDREITAACDLLSCHRLVTITGPGGVGKTRLAEQVAARESGRRLVWVSLAALADFARIAEVIAAAMDITTPSADVTEVICRALGHAPTLLVLDNLEHLLPRAAPMVGALLDAVPDFRCLATSRGAVKTEGEQTLPLAALPSSPPDAPFADAAENPAVRLFVDRAQAVRPDFRLTLQNVTDIAALCRDLDGLPLAIELAAARILAFTPRRMREMLRHSPEQLLSRGQGRAHRHQSLYSALDWSYCLLSPDRQAFLRALTVFHGAFTAPAAQAVTGVEDAEHMLAELAEASLVQVRHDGEENCFFLLETMRGFCQSRISEPERAHFATRHAAYYLTWAENYATRLYGSEHREASAWFLREPDNLLAASETLTPEPEKLLRLINAMCWYFREVSPEAGAARLLRALDDAPDAPPDLRAEAHITANVLLGALGRTGEQEAARDLFQRSGNHAGVAHALCQTRAEGALRTGAALARQSGDKKAEGRALIALGVALWPQGRIADAGECFSGASKLLHQADLPYYRIGALFEWGYFLNYHGEARRAFVLLEQASSLSAEVGGENTHPKWIGASAACHLGRYARAEQDAEHAYRERGKQGMSLPLRIPPLAILCRALFSQGKLTEADAAYTELCDLLEKQHGTFPLYHAGTLAVEREWARDDLGAALAASEHNLDQSGAHGVSLARCGFWDGFAPANHRSAQAWAEIRLGWHNRAEITLRETLAFRARTGILGRALSDIEGIAVCFAHTGREAQAARLFGATDALRLRGGTPNFPFEEAFLRPLRADARGRLREQWCIGADMNLRNTIADALSACETAEK